MSLGIELPSLLVSLCFVVFSALSCVLYFLLCSFLLCKIHNLIEVFGSLIIFLYFNQVFDDMGQDVTPRSLLQVDPTVK